MIVAIPGHLLSTPCVIGRLCSVTVTIIRHLPYFGVIGRLYSVIVTIPGHLPYSWCHWYATFCDCGYSSTSSILLVSLVGYVL